MAWRGWITGFLRSGGERRSGVRGVEIPIRAGNREMMAAIDA
jgi:hypothetical protein